MNDPVVVVIGPNPAIDIVLDVPGIRAGEVWRSRRSIHLAGGKPLNVSRTLRRLGVGVRLVAPLGGSYGGRDRVLAACRDLGIEARTLSIEGEIRTCIVVVDSTAGNATVINESGPELSEGEAAAFQDLVIGALDGASLGILSGSLPPGLSPEFSRHLVQAARNQDVKLLVDTSGTPLRQTLDAGAWGVKVNQTELMDVVQASSVESACIALAERVEHVVVTMGAKGALYAGPDGTYSITGPSIEVVNPIGSGDAFLAGLAAGLVRGGTWPEALALAQAAAALATGAFTPDIGPGPDLDDVSMGVEIRKLPILH